MIQTLLRLVGAATRMHIGKPSRSVTGMISGHPQRASQAEMDRPRDVFPDPAGDL